jgi:hypothetical protein
MSGNIYAGVVVRTANILACEGSSAVVTKSEIVHTEGPFVALSDDSARALLLANAIAAKKVNINDPTAPVEVKITLKV